MKKKRVFGYRNEPSNKHKIRQSTDTDLTNSSVMSDDIMHDIVETLSDKVEQFNQIIQDFNLPPRESPNASASPLQEMSALMQDESINDILNDSGERILDNVLLDNLLYTQQGNDTSNAQNVSSTIAHRTSYNYAPDNAVTYDYGFTNSEFFAFIANLDPVEFILTITVITVLIAINLNVFEKQVVSAALVDIGVTLGNMVQQELFQSARQNEAATNERNQALQNDLDTLYNDIEQLQAQLNALRQQLNCNNQS